MFIKKHNVVITIALLLIIACSVNLYNHYKQEQKFKRGHPLVNKVYRSYVVERPADGGEVTTVSYLIFGDEEHRGKYLEIYKSDGGYKRVKQLMHNKKEYDKEFKDYGEDYFVSGNELYTDINKRDQDYDHQLKDGKNWEGLYTSNNKSEEEPGDIHMTTPINVK